MTAKKDLKRRIRERQARTGESYTAARTHVVGRREAEEVEPAAPAPPFEVEEMIDVTDAAAALGFHCTVLASSKLLPHVGAAEALGRLRDVLLATLRDPGTERLRELAFGGEIAGRAEARAWRERAYVSEVRAFLERARAGLGGVSPRGDLLAVPIAGQRGLVVMLCHLGHAAVRGLPEPPGRPARLILTIL